MLIVGEKGGATAKTVFVGFGLAFVYKFLMQAPEALAERRRSTADHRRQGSAKAASLGGEPSPELLGVGYIIGPRIASIMVAGGVLAYLVWCR